MGVLPSWERTLGVRWQSPWQSNGRFHGSMRVIVPSMSFKNSHVLVSFEGGAMCLISL